MTKCGINLEGVYEKKETGETEEEKTITKRKKEIRSTL